jgi:uncharacterized protein YggE
MSDQQKPTKKLVLIAAIVAAGLLAAVFAASQLTANATAQSEGGQTTDTQPPVTSADEIDCEIDPSQIHCVEDAELISAPLENGDKSTLSTTGMATTKTAPDMFSVTVGIETNSTTAAEAASANAELVNATIAALAELGIAEEQMATSAYNLFPVYAEVAPDEACIEVFPPPPGCEPSTEITGYKASSSLTVTLDAEGEVDAGTVIDTSIGAGANNVSGVFFFLSPEKQQEVQDGLIAEAIANARHKADIAAQALEMEVTGIHSVSLEDVHFPIFARGAEVLQADAATQILPGQQEVTSTVSITYIISPIAGGTEDGASAEAEVEEGAGVESETAAGETETGAEAETGTGIEVEEDTSALEELPAELGAILPES